MKNNNDILVFHWFQIKIPEVKNCVCRSISFDSHSPEIEEFKKYWFFYLNFDFIFLEISIDIFYFQEVFRWQNHRFHPYIGNLLGKKFRQMLSLVIVINIETQFTPKPPNAFLPTRSKLQAFYFLKINRLKNQRFFFACTGALVCRQQTMAKSSNFLPTFEHTFHWNNRHDFSLQYLKR